MKKLLLILFAALLVLSVNAQEKSKKQKLTRQEKKELKQKREEETIKTTTAIIDAKQFVLEADLIKNRRGQTFPVNSNINFVMVDSNRAVFQFGSAHTIGVNGVGGATIEGEIQSYDSQRNKKSGAYYIVINISTTTGFYEIRLDVLAAGRAEAQITALSRNRIDYIGRLVPIYQSGIFKGISH